MRPERRTENEYLGFIRDQLPVCCSASMYFFLVLRRPIQMTELTMPHSMLVCSVPCRCKNLALFCSYSRTKAPFFVSLPNVPCHYEEILNSETNYVHFWKTENKNHTQIYNAHWNLYYPVPPIFLSYSQHLWPHKGQTSQLQTPDVRH